MNCAWCLEGGGVHTEFFPHKTGLLLHFSDSKSECSEYLPMEEGVGFSNGWCITGSNVQIFFSDLQWNLY